MAVINTNFNALAAQESSRASGLKLSQSMERLSTGLKINSAKDDAAGLAISNRMTSQIRGIAKATQNANDAISMTQTAEGAMSNVNDILQRMRELAVQATTGTLNDADRSSIQLEVAQLKNQIDDIAKKTNHNNIKLLDGSAQNVKIQTGTNSGDTIAIGFSSVQTKDIGIGSRATLMSAGGKLTADTNFDALSVNALFINGVAIDASYAVDDNASSANNSASAIAKAVAINRQADTTGVYAKAETNTVSGQTMTVEAASSSVSLTINGVATDTFATSTADLSLNRKASVAAINAISARTGVTAVDTGDDKLGVQLLAADGRNIVVSGGKSDTSGVVTGTYVGSYSLYTLDNRDINISYKTGATSVQAMSGLRAGSYKSDVANTTTYARASVSAAAPSTSNAGLLDGSALVLNGVQITAAVSTDDTASNFTTTSSTRAASAIAIAAAINKSSSQTGVTATAAPNILRGSSFAGDISANGTITTVNLNGVVFSVNSTSLNAVVDSFNSVSNQTGVVASVWGSGMQLTAADGRNISITANHTATGLGLTGVTIGNTASALPDGQGAVTYYSQVTLSSANNFTVKAGSTGVANLELLGFRQGTYGGSGNGSKVNQIDVSTATGASLAIATIDGAINNVSANQAKVGAYTNRLDVIVNNLAESNQNMQASRSRIMDTDYSAETTNLAKNQIIQQAATAMLAQANQSAQSVLSLLK